MEFTTFSLYVSLVIFFLIILLKRNPRKTIINLPPGPKKLPIIGNLHQIISSSSSSGNLIHHVLRDLSKKYGPLMHLKFGEVPTIVINSPEMAKEIYKTHDVVFAQRPTNLLVFKIVSYNFSDIIFSPYGNYWKNLRKICIMELLNPKRVHSFRSIREDEVLNMIRKILLSLRDNNNKEEETVINLSQMIFALTYGITSRVAFGKRSKSQEKFEEHVVEINKMAAEAGFNVCDLYPSWKFLEIFSIGVKRKMERVMNQVDEIIQEILNEHRQKMENSDNNNNNNNVGWEDEEEDDIVDVLLRIQKNEDFEVPLADTNLKAVLFNIFSAGSETSSTTLEWAISETLKNPRILKRAQEEVRNKFDERGNVDEESSNISDLKYLEAIVKETLRLHPSAPLLLPRENSQHCKINGYDIPAKTRVIVNAWAIGRDPNFWTDEPEVFKPERFLESEVIDYKGNHFQYIPFGAGRRICPGISFALSNIMLPLAQLLFHFDWKISGDGERNYKLLEELDMEESLGVSVRRKTDLKLIPVPYHRSAIHT